jgi:hypothetical protein
MGCEGMGTVKGWGGALGLRTRSRGCAAVLWLRGLRVGWTVVRM